MDAGRWKRQTTFVLLGCRLTDCKAYPTIFLVQLLQEVARLPNELTASRADFIHGAKSRSSNDEKSEDRESLYLHHPAFGQPGSHERDLNGTEIIKSTKGFLWPVNRQQTSGVIRSCTWPSVSCKAAKVALSLTILITSRPWYQCSRCGETLRPKSLTSRWTLYECYGIARDVLDRGVRIGAASTSLGRYPKRMSVSGGAAADPEFEGFGPCTRPSTSWYRIALACISMMT